MSQATVQADSALTLTISASTVFFALPGATTGTGTASAVQVLASDMKTFFEGGTVNEFTLTTAIATPSAYVATTFTGFASTVSGASIMGFGTTNDVTLMNRAGTPVLGITANTSDTTLAGALQIGTSLSILGTTVNLSTAGAALAFTGTTVASVADTASGAITFNANIGRGTGAVGGFVFAVPVTTSSGTTAQTLTNALVISSVSTTPTVFVGGTDALATAVRSNAGVLYGPRVIFALAAATNTALSAVRVNGTLASPTALNSGDAIGGFNMRGAVSTTAIAIGASILATTTEAWSAAATGTKITFNVTSNTTTANVAALTLDQDKSATFAANVNTATYFGSTTALATPSALAATALNVFASTVSGAAIMGFGTTNDVALMNRAGTVVLGIGPNTTAVNMTGALSVTGLTTLGASAGTAGVVIDGTAFGAGVASLRFNGLSTAAVNNQVGTLTNAPVAGNPAFWLPISVAGTIRYLACW